jgi:hypothetical protein
LVSINTPYPVFSLVFSILMSLLFKYEAGHASSQIFHLY